jgi:hypothetical protein
MGTITGPGVTWWDTFNTLLDPSSLFSYSGSGFTFNNPLRYKGWTDWTMTDNTNLVAGSGISKYVKQTSVQQYSQKIVQVGSTSNNKFTCIFIYRQPQAADYRTIVQWQSNDLGFYVEANGNITMKSSNTNYTTSGLAMTDNSWRHYVFTRSGTAATMYVNGSLFTTFTGLSDQDLSARASAGKTVWKGERGQAPSMVTHKFDFDSNQKSGEDYEGDRNNKNVINALIMQGSTLINVPLEGGLKSIVGKVINLELPSETGDGPAKKSTHGGKHLVIAQGEYLNVGDSGMMGTAAIQTSSGGQQGSVID